MLRNDLQKIPCKKWDCFFVILHEFWDTVAARDELEKKALNKEEADVTKISAHKEPNQARNSKPLLIDASE